MSTNSPETVIEVASHDLFGWLPIATAPKDRVTLVNDTTGQSPWAAARWVESPEWSGWIYDDDAAADCNPTGPEPTHWLDVPSLPNDQVEQPPKGGSESNSGAVGG